MKGLLMDWKGSRRKWFVAKYRYNPEIFLEGLRKTTSQDIRYPR
jgi:hypothetical protein